MKNFLRGTCFFAFLSITSFSTLPVTANTSQSSSFTSSLNSGMVVNEASDAPASHSVSGDNKSGIAARYGDLPLRFEINQGQSAEAVKFLARGPGYNLFLAPDEAVLVLRKEDKPSTIRSSATAARETVVRTQFLGANKTPRLRGVDPLPGVSHYFKGSDAKQWRSNIAHYAKVEYQDVYPGIDLVYYGKQRQFEYDFIVAPGADPKAITLSFQGADRIAIAPTGELILHVPGGQLVQHKPFIYQDIGGKRSPVSGRYVVGAGQTVSFQVASYDTGKPLVIDPILSYSTYLGGRGADYGYDIALDTAGNAYITGQTLSPDFPTTASAVDRSCGTEGNCNNRSSMDAFITKLNASGSALVYSSFLGGGGLDSGNAVAVDGNGSAYVAGITYSGNFPTTVGAFDRVCGTNACGGGFVSDVFVAKLTPNGSALSYSTFLGGDDFEGDLGLAIAINGIGAAFVTGNTTSINFPIQNPLRTINAGADDVFVTQLTPAGNALAYSTYLGGADPDVAKGIVLDGNNNAHITGATNSANFPTTAGAFDGTFNGMSDAFKLTLGPGGNTLVYSTYLGGAEVDAGRAIALDGAGNAYVTGDTASANFPTILGSFQTLSLAGDDAFVSKLSGAGALVYSTYLAGSSDEAGTGIAVDNGGNAYITGFTNSANFPVLSPYQATQGGGVDAFIAKLSPGGGALDYATYLGGAGNDFGRAIAIDAAGNAYVTGETSSSNFPTTVGARDQVCGVAANCDNGSADAFVTKIGSPPGAGTFQFGAPGYTLTENGGSITISVTRSSGGSGAVAVNYATSDGTASAGSDYTAKSGTLNFTAGDTAPQTFNIAVIDNALFEARETINLTLSNPTGGAILAAPTTAVLSIVNDDPGPPGILQFSMSNFDHTESTAMATVTVTRSGGTSGAVSVRYATSNGTARADADYTATSGMLSFPTGVGGSRTFTIIINRDAAIEPSETINLMLSNPTGGALLGSVSRATMTILDNDATLQFSAATYTVNENANVATITVTRKGRRTSELRVNYTTGNGSAVAGTDYSGRSGTLVFPFNVFTRTFTIPIIDNGTAEPSETVNLTLSNPNGFEVSLGTPRTAVLTIVDND